VYEREIAFCIAVAKKIASRFIVSRRNSCYNQLKKWQRPLQILKTKESLDENNRQGIAAVLGKPAVLSFAHILSITTARIRRDSRGRAFRPSTLFFYCNTSLRQSHLRRTLIMTIDRRAFSKSVVLALCCAALPSVSGAKDSVAVRYRHRMRFTRQQSKFDFWVRVAKINDVSADVPFTLVISSDAAGQQVLRSVSHVSHAMSSHIARGSIDLQAAGWKTGSPLFGHVIFDNGSAKTKVRQIGSRQQQLGALG
jgi:hypothetical protein